jgi:hypothetical protein
MDGFIGVDFDCTLATYTKGTSPEDMGKPIKPMVDRVKSWIKEGKDVRIFSARGKDSYPAMRRWMKEHLGVILPITNIKEPTMVAFYDDKAIAIEANIGEPYSQENENEVLERAEK